MLFFLPISVFEEKEYQTESKRNETFRSVIFGTNVIRRTWSGRQETNEDATRQGERPPPSWAPRSSTDLLLPPIYTYVPPNHQTLSQTLFPPPQPSVPLRSHLGAFSGAPPEGESIMEGLYIISKASPMSCD